MLRAFLPFFIYNIHTISVSVKRLKHIALSIKQKIYEFFKQSS